MVNSFDDAMQRIPSQRQKIVNLLRDAGEEGVPNSDLVKISFRYGAHLSALYKEGYVITNNLEGKGIHRYFLKKVPGEVVIQPDADNLLYEALMKSNVPKEYVNALFQAMCDADLKVVRKMGYYKQRMNLH